MEAQQHDSSAANQPLAFNRFLDIMNQDAAKDLVRRINVFMRDIKQRDPDPEVDRRLVQGFFEQMEQAMAQHPLWAGSSPQDLEAATEALEKYVMTKLHDRTFGTAPEDTERDALLAARCSGLQFVRPSHLEIPASLGSDASLTLAAKELNKINMFKAPRDKLVCILNCCRVINNLLVAGAKGDSIGADDFTPLLIYVVVRAQTAQLASNLAFIERYRYVPRLTGEAQYYFVQSCSAATFLEMITASSLRVDRDEFIAHMLAAGAMSEAELGLLSAGGSVDVTGAYSASAEGAATRDGEEAAAVAAAPGVAGLRGVADQVGSGAAVGAAACARAAAPKAGTPAAAPLQMQALPGGPAVVPRQLPPPPPPSVSELEAAGVQLMARAGEAVQQLLPKRYPFIFSSFESLNVSDVAQLLSAYKELVLRYEILRTGVEGWQATQAQLATQPVAPSPQLVEAPPPAQQDLLVQPALQASPAVPPVPATAVQEVALPSLQPSAQGSAPAALLDAAWPNTSAPQATVPTPLAPPPQLPSAEEPIQPPVQPASAPPEAPDACATEAAAEQTDMGGGVSATSGAQPAATEAQPGPACVSSGSTAGAGPSAAAEAAEPAVMGAHAATAAVAATPTAAVGEGTDAATDAPAVAAQHAAGAQPPAEVASPSIDAVDDLLSALLGSAASAPMGEQAAGMLRVGDGGEAPSTVAASAPAEARGPQAAVEPPMAAQELISFLDGELGTDTGSQQGQTLVALPQPQPPAGASLLD